MSFWLLDKVRWLTSTPTTTPAHGPNKYSPTPAIKKSTLKNITTLKYWDVIMDDEWIEREVVAVDMTRKIVFLTWENRDLTDYERVYAWTQEKITNAISEKGFELVTD